MRTKLRIAKLNKRIELEVEENIEMRSRIMAIEAEIIRLKATLARVREVVEVGKEPGVEMHTTLMMIEQILSSDTPEPLAVVEGIVADNQFPITKNDTLMVSEGNATVPGGVLHVTVIVLPREEKNDKF